MIYKLICVKCDELYESRILNPDPADDKCMKCREGKPQEIINVEDDGDECIYEGDINE